MGIHKAVYLLENSTLQLNLTQIIYQAYFHPSHLYFAEKGRHKSGSFE